MALALAMMTAAKRNGSIVVILGFAIAARNQVIGLDRGITAADYYARVRADKGEILFVMENVAELTAADAHR